MMTGESRGFSRVAVWRVVFSRVKRGTHVASRVAPGSPVSIRVSRGIATLLSSHVRGIRPQGALKGESRGLSRVAAGNPGIPHV